MIRYAFELHDFRRWISGFSKLLYIPATGGRLSIPQHLGTGYIRTGHLCNGISYIVMDFSLRDDLVLTQQSAAPGFSLFFDQEPGSNNLRFSSSGEEQETLYRRDSQLKKIGLLFPPSFTRRYLRKEILSDLLRCTENKSSARNKEPVPFEYRQSLEDIFHTDPHSPMYHLLLHNRLLLLTEKFLYSSIARSQPPAPDGGGWAKGKEKDLEALKNIMRILSDNQLNKFPSIEALSRAATMSSTKLKNRFKQVYGMKLYEFYNHHRLEQAKEMLKTGSYSVKQVGINIGFSNLSNFAKAFKKEFGLLPKDLLKHK
jgi:AraC-like DNA-binding protein